MELLWKELSKSKFQYFFEQLNRNLGKPKLEIK